MSTTAALVCVKGQPGPHYYLCGRPSNDVVHCVCRSCGDEKDLPGTPERRHDRMTKEEWQKFKRLRASRGGVQVMVPHDPPTADSREDELSTGLGLDGTKTEPEIEPEIVQNQDEIRTETTFPPTTADRGRRKRTMKGKPTGTALHDGNYRFRRHEELEAEKEKIITCWRKHGGNISKASKELKISYSTLKGKLVQWELVPGWPSYRRRCPARPGGDPTGIEAQAQMNNLLTSLYDERARIDSQIKSVKTAMELLVLQGVTTK